MLNCPHCNKGIDEKILESHRAKKLVRYAKKKYGEDYSDEMRRRIKIRWANHVSDKSTTKSQKTA